MFLKLKISHLCLILMLPSIAGSQDTLHFRGQISAWTNLSPESDLPVWLGGRIIPQANYEWRLPSDKLLDFEASTNINGAAGFSLIDSLKTEGTIKAYRAWARFSGKQFELRAGLQKINFGSATMLRPLMWFDQMDPRDPLQLTDGVWGVLGRYYFLNNTNIWLWTLVGNKGIRAWEIMETPPHGPEFGGRIQVPVLPGEAAFSYHFRDTRISHSISILAGMPNGDIGGINNLLPPGMEGIHPEHRFALDGKWDIGPGVWFESVWIHNAGNFGILSNQTMLNLGTDYTFGLGNGLNMVFEHLIFSFDDNAFAFDNIASFSALSVSYPLNMNHHVSTILYRDWDNRNFYSFVNWRIQLPRFMLYTMAFWNPDNYSLPQQASTSQLFAGKGVQLMLVYNF
jgi:hypothetical protein